MTSPSERRPGRIVPPAAGRCCLEQDRPPSSSRVTVLDIYNLKSVHTERISHLPAILEPEVA